MRWIPILLFAATTVSAAEPHAYRVARLWPGDGPVIADAVLVVRDGKIVAAGRRADVTIPNDAVIRELRDATIVPGLIAAETSLAERGRDDLHALTPHHRAIDGYDPYADYSSALSGGVTTVQIAPGGRRLLPGQCAVVKLHGSDLSRRTLRDVESLRVVLGDAFKNPPKIYEPPVGAVSVDRPLEVTKPQLAAGLGSAAAGLRASLRAARESSPDNQDAYLKAIAGSGTAARPLRVVAPTAADVQVALQLARDFDLKLVLVDPPVVPEKLEEWKAHVIGVVLSPGVRPGAIADDAPAKTAAEAARDLRAAGFRVAIKPGADGDLKEMLYLGGLVTSRVPAVDALRMMTADAAALLGVADRVGTLTPGKDADFVVLSGDPFALHTRVLEVNVDGHAVTEKKPAGQRRVVRAGRVLTGTGEAIANGAVLVDGRTIRAVGRDVSTPADAEESRFANAVIVPGFLDLGNGLGVGGPINAPIAITTKLGDRLVSGDPAIRTARQGGVTTALLSGPAPSPVLAFKFGDRLRPVKDPVAVRLALRGNLTQSGAALRDSLRAGKAYSDAWTKYDADYAAYLPKKQEFDAAQAKAAEKKAEDKKDEKKPEEKKPEEKKSEEKKPEDRKPEEKKPEPPKAPEKPQTVDALEPYRMVFAGRIPALVEASREDAIRLAVAICRDEFNIRTVLIGATDAHRLADLLAAKSVAVIAGPELVRTVERDDVNLPMALALRGAAFGFQSQATSGARQLPLAVGYAVRHGLGADEALRGLTSGPAQFLGLDSLGVLAAGRDADLVVLSGMPFELSTRVLAVMIDGQWVYRDND